MNQTRGLKRFTISEVAANWYELMIPQRIMRPSIAGVCEQLDSRFAAIADIITAPISHVRPSHHSSNKPLLILHYAYMKPIILKQFM